MKKSEKPNVTQLLDLIEAAQDVGLQTSFTFKQWTGLNELSIDFKGPSKDTSRCLRVNGSQLEYDTVLFWVASLKEEQHQAWRKRSS